MTRTKVVLWSTIVLVAMSVWFLLPTFKWYRLPQADRDQMERDRDPIINKILNLGLDLRGGTHLVLEIDRAKLDPKINVRDAIDRAIEIIRNRVDSQGLAEPLIARQGDYWIVVQLPAVKDPDLAKELIGKTALLEFRLVDDSGALATLSKELSDKKLTVSQYYDRQKSGELTSDLQKLVPAGHELVKMQEANQFMVVESSAQLTGSTLVDAKVSFGGGGGNQLAAGLPTVSIEFNSEGTQRFAAVTEANVNHRLAILLDGIVQSAPVIRSAIPDGHAEISGDFTPDSAKVLATVLKAGALPAPVKVIEERTVGPSLGEDSIKAGVRASIIGVLLVVLFMLIYYRMSGLIADLAMIINMIFLFGVMASWHATITLPGIAGTILSLAMAVDANVLILERVREELQNGKTPRLAIDLGYRHAWPAIIDGHITNLISAALMYQFGTGPVKGFAVTLFWGVLISIFTAVFFTHMVYDVWLAGDNPPQLKFMQLFKRTNFDFIGKRYVAFAFSTVLLLAGIASLVVKKGPKLGIDFTGGTLVQLGFQNPVQIPQLRSMLSNAGYPDAELQDFPAEKSVIIRVQKTEDSPDALAKKIIALTSEKMTDAKPLAIPQRAEYVGPAIGKALADQALMAICLATLLIIVYVAIRFRSMLWGICSIAALVHDVLSVVGIFSILNKEITVTVVAGILTLAGYSMNDTIVVYDRMRENLRMNKKESLGEIINRSVNETLSRTIMTSLTVAITVAVFFFTGGSVIHDFSFAMLWGVFVGSYSSIFVAAPIIYEWDKRRKSGSSLATKTGGKK